MVRSWTLYLQLSDAERMALREGLSEDAALHLLKLGEREERDTLLSRALRDGMTAAQVGEEVRRILLGERNSEAVTEQLGRVRRLFSPAKLAKMPPERRTALQEELEDLLKRYS